MMKSIEIHRNPLKLIIISFLISICFYLFPGIADAATYYVSPSGSGTACTSSSPCAISQLTTAGVVKAGDTWIMKNGTYNTNLKLDCSAGINNGTSASPITLKSENERQAFIKGDGWDDAFKITYCNWWRIEGLHIESADNADSPYGEVAVMSHVNNLVFRRNLVARPNRYANAGGIGVYYDSHSVLIEENELYDFHRNGIECYPETTGGCIIRRNFVSRGIPYLGQRWGPNDAIVMYFAHDSIVENNIVDGLGVAFNNSGSNNKFAGNIALNSSNGYTNNKHTQYGPYSSGNLFENNVAVNVINGFMARSATSVVFKNVMSVGTQAGSAAFYGDNSGDSRNASVYNNTYCLVDDVCFTIAPDVSIINALALNSAGSGFYFAEADQFSSLVIDRVNSYNGNPNFAGNVTSFLTGATEIDPQLGTCKVWLPDSSPLKGMGTGNADIGANILYRYQNGVLTSQPLWDPATGQFPHGAIVPGLNDIPGRSAYDVNQRLNIDTNGCPFPAGYGTTSSSLQGDINNDRIVNSLDWSLMSAKWLTADSSADLNKDGAVNSLDWSIMSSNWLKTI